MEDTDKAIELDSSNAEAHYHLAIIKYKLNDWNGAHADFDKAIHYKSDFAYAYLQRGFIKYIKNNSREALLDINSLLSWR